MHVLSTPPAFVLSQDQTLVFNPLTSILQPAKASRYKRLTHQNLTVLFLALAVSFSRIACRRFRDGRPLYQIRSRLSTRFFVSLLGVSSINRLRRFSRWTVIVSKSIPFVNTFFVSLFGLSSTNRLRRFSTEDHCIKCDPVCQHVFSCHFMVSHLPIIFAVFRDGMSLYQMWPGLSTHFSCHFLAALDQSLPTFLRQNVILTNMKAFVNTNFQANT